MSQNFKIPQFEFICSNVYLFVDISDMTLFILHIDIFIAFIVAN